MSRGLRWIVVLAGLLVAASATAHQRSVSYSNWTFDDTGATVHARVSQLDLSRVGLAMLDQGGADDPVAHMLSRGLRLSVAGEPCPPTHPPTPRKAPDGWAVYGWHVTCPDGPRTLETGLLLDVAPSHLHFASVAAPGRSRVERLLSEAEPAWEEPGATVDDADTGGSSFGGYVTLGVEHILGGWDHLAFVLALLLLARTLGEVATLVTAFTAAHSVTLGLATLGWVQPEPAAIEALIGFSIALVAVENSWILGGRDRIVPWVFGGGLVALAAIPEGAVSRIALLGLAVFSLCHFGLLRLSSRPARLRAVVAFAFGLVHGFGFAGVLNEMQLPASRLVPALFGFNIGVELGQLGVVMLVWPALQALERVSEGRPARLVAEVGSAAICGLGLYWFLVRNLG